MINRTTLILGAGCLLVAVRASAVTPTILSEPQSITVNNASAAAFTVVASNAVAYQWQFQATNNLPGATNATLSLDDVSSNQAGSYTVVATSADNISVTSTPPALLRTVPGTIVQLTISTYPNGSSSNFLVQLFDHDKPATVENFIHYITSGSYSNTFFDRDVTGFVLQAGDYVTYDRTTNGLNGGAVSTGTNIFPSQVDSEFNVGPLIHNNFGTLAMALVSGEPNSATSAFFFNLADNSTNLDTQNGGFTVFGRILTGTNILQYFNTLSAPSNGIFDLEPSIPTLPVNYDGTNEPTDANLFYCDFTFQTPPPVDTTPPTVAITYPAPNAALTNGGDLTLRGTAQDNVGLAEVFCALNTLTGVYEGASQTNAALGTTNWSLDFGTNAPGVYQLTAYAQDGAGNLSAPATEYFTNLAILTIITNVNGHLTTNVQYLVPGQTYSLTAAQLAGDLFVNWQNQGVVSLDPVQQFTAETNFALTVTFVSTNLPGGLTITSPAAGSTVQTTNDGLTFTGTLPPSITVTKLTCQLFSQSNAVTAPLPAAINGTNWSVAVSNLAGGPYTIVVVAADSLGQEGLVAEDFTALVSPPRIISQPPNLTVNTGSSADFSVTASNAASYQWELVGTRAITGATSATLALEDVSAIQSGSSYMVVITAPDGEVVTSAPAVLTVVPGTIIQLTISKFGDGSSSNLLVELFDHDKPATVANFTHYITSGAFSNTFFDTDTNFTLQAGDYVTYDRTTNGLNGGAVSTGTNVFPSQVDSEFNVGPVIHNTFGTLAMALISGESNSATSGFFFNLADNSTILDPEDDTVFGRILSGTNILQYFNTLSAPSNGIFDLSYSIPSLPVNYDGTNEPTDANLFYCDFAFQTPPPVDTTPPMVSITFPAPSAAFTNGASLTVQGTAQDNVGLAEVFCILSSSTGAYNNESQTNAAIGTTNWSLDLVSELGTIKPGVYQLTAFAQDGAGNLSAPATEYFTNLTRLTLITNVDGHLTTNVTQYLVPGQQYSVTATPGPGQQFYSWISNGVTSLNPVQTFTANENLTLTVTYLSSNSSAGLTITSPVSGTRAYSIQSVLTVSGTIASTNVTQLTCQFFVNSNSISTARPASISGTNWSLTVTNYDNGTYTVVALGTNATGGSSFVSAHFTLLNVELLTLNIVGSGTVVSNPGPYLVPGTYTVKAAPKSGNVFYSWSDGFITTLNPARTFHIVSNLTLTAMFIPEDTSLKGITFTYPPSDAMLTNGTFNVVGRVPASLIITQMTCQLFLQSNGVTAAPQPVTIDPAGAKWSLSVSNLTPGPYRVLAVGYDNGGKASLVSENFNLLAKFGVGVQPSSAGTVTSGLNGKYLEVGKRYSIVATPRAGELFAFWTGAVANTGSSATTFVMSSNTVLTANFASNLFPGVAGNYTGLFLSPNNVSPTSAGFVSVTVTRTGAFSGELKFPSRTYPIAWDFPYNGIITLRGKGLDTNTLELILSLDLTNGTDTITGYVIDLTSSGDIVWSSSLVLYRAVTSLSASNAPAAGKYVLLLRPETTASGPVATGFAAVSLGVGGTLALGGSLPDNLPISGSARMSKDGIWPVYIVPSSYNSKGMIIGWQTNTPSGARSGQLYWFKPAIGYATNLTSTGAAFAPPLADTQYQMVVADGTTNVLPVGAARQFVAQEPIEAVSLLPTGVLSGYIDVNEHEVRFKGAFISPSDGGAGFILDANGQMQGFQILPQP
ncbi:MAG TPA: peptidylprolyl isomerase [Candidatus Baltobacteraceae bacterium]|nr:peptidylprolyl isomerase [Candidatus Baltobacteraceae bacterium]